MMVVIKRLAASLLMTVAIQASSPAYSQVRGKLLMACDKVSPGIVLSAEGSFEVLQVSPTSNLHTFTRMGGPPGVSITLDNPFVFKCTLTQSLTEYIGNVRLRLHYRFRQAAEDTAHATVRPGRIWKEFSSDLSIPIIFPSGGPPVVFYMQNLTDRFSEITVKGSARYDKASEPHTGVIAVIHPSFATLKLNPVADYTNPK